MSKVKGSATLSGMVDTDMEDDTLNGDAFPTPDSNQENTGPKRKGAKAKPAAKKFTKAKAPSRRTSGATVIPKNAPASKAKAGRKRVPLKDQTNQQYADDTEEVDEFAAQTEGDTVMDDLAESKAKMKKAAPAKKGGRPPKAAAQCPIAEKQKDGEFEYTPTAIRTIKPAKRVPASKNEKIIQDTQAPVETDQSMLPEEDPEDQEMPQPAFHRPTNARNTSQQRRPLPIPRRRAGSASSTERHTGVGEAATRRKLGEITKKFENLDLKYRTLRETGIKEAEANFERLRIQSESKAKAAHDLINSLKKELATQKALNTDTSSFQKQIDNRDADLIKTRALADDLSTQLAEVQNENKALQAKLANSRSVSAAVESLEAKTPGSALRARQQLQGGRTIMVGSAEAAQAAQVAQLKEDLYSDLTGLILRGVERGAESDIYDCIQTGRNGSKCSPPSLHPSPLPSLYSLIALLSCPCLIHKEADIRGRCAPAALHFKLAIAKDPDETYENTEFQYTPRLDGNRDRDLIALLPEYLTDEIIFSRTNAAMFYGRVVETLTKRRKVDDE